MDKKPTTLATVTQPSQNSLTNRNQELTGSGIPGFENIPMSDLPIPSIKIVGENTKDKSLANGKEATNGKFLHTGRREEFDSFTFRPLSGSKGTTLGYGKEDSPENYVPQYVIVAIDETDNEPFLLYLQSSNLNSFRKVLGEMKRLANQGIPPYALKITADIETLNSDKYKWKAMRFSWEVSELSDEQKALFQRLFSQYSRAAAENANRKEETVVEIKDFDDFNAEEEL